MMKMKDNGRLAPKKEKSKKEKSLVYMTNVLFCSF